MTRNKYHAVPTIVDGIRFASKREALWYRVLRSDVKQGLVRAFECQPRFVLQPGPVAVRIVYIADFWVHYANGTEEVWDVKGVETAAFRLKAKLFRTRYPLLPLVIKR